MGQTDYPGRNKRATSDTILGYLFRQTLFLLQEKNIAIHSKLYRKEVRAREGITISLQFFVADIITENETRKEERLEQETRFLELRPCLFGVVKVEILMKERSSIAKGVLGRDESYSLSYLMYLPIFGFSKYDSRQ
ncbi:hypothetical protein ACJIZ3_017553 [Penstemon smallii]|uniref:Uncharacterized protein n=1 Tax=Penstemon smallii TaxID=265156 RepID=A0ABD3SWG3_9LAMI